MDLRIRRTHDIEHIQELDRDAFPADKPLSEDHLQDAKWWVLGADAGYVGLWSANDQEAILVRYGVDERHRGQGLGRRLVRHSVRAARRLGYVSLRTYVGLHKVDSMRCLLACGLRPTGVEGNWMNLELTL